MLAAATAPLSFVLSARTAFTGTRYAKSHEYIKAEGNGVGRVGISDYAQKALGDLVFVELPAVGAQKKRGVCGTNTRICTCKHMNTQTRVHGTGGPCGGGEREERERRVCAGGAGGAGDKQGAHDRPDAAEQGP